jgi:predicted oxidoreductase
MTDAVVVGTGLSGLVAAVEIAAAGRHVTVLDQEPPQALGGQAHWSFGGLFSSTRPNSDDFAFATRWSSPARSAGRPRSTAGRLLAAPVVPRISSCGRREARVVAFHGHALVSVAGWAERGPTPCPALRRGTGPAVIAVHCARSSGGETDGPSSGFAIEQTAGVERGAVVGVRGAVSPRASPSAARSARDRWRLEPAPPGDRRVGRQAATTTWHGSIGLALGLTVP